MSKFQRSGQFHQFTILFEHEKALKLQLENTMKNKT